MSAADRLTELRRQRDLIRDHLAWLEREIRHLEPSEENDTGPSSPERPTQAATAAGPAHRELPAAAHPIIAAGSHATSGPAGVLTPSVAAMPADQTETPIDSILEQYRTPTTDLQRDVRTGCFLYFAAALLILGGIVAILYLALRH